MICDAWIEVKTHYTYAKGKVYEYNSYTWKGKKITSIDKVLLSQALGKQTLKEGDVFRLGLFLYLRVVESRAWRNDYLVMREGLEARFLWGLHQALWRADLFYRRLIIAASVFNLADCPVGEIPNWRQLKWFRKEH